MLPQVIDCPRLQRIIVRQIHLQPLVQVRVGALPGLLAEVRRQIGALKAAEHPVVRLVYPKGPHEHKVAYRPWADVPESAKLSMLRDLVDWRGISNRDMAHMLLGELDVGKLTSGQRDLLIRFAEPVPAPGKGRVSLDELKHEGRQRSQVHTKQRDHGMER